MAFPSGTDVVLNDFAVNDFMFVLSLLEKLKINYWVADGTLLGLYRGGNFIPHDTDIDFYTLECGAFPELEQNLIQSGYSVGRNMKKFGFQFQLTFISPHGNLIDFCNWRVTSSDKVEFFAPEIGYRRLQSIEFFKDSREYNLSGYRFRSFVNAEGWLAMMYGESWVVPEDSKSDWRNHVRDR